MGVTGTSWMTSPLTVAVLAALWVLSGRCDVTGSPGSGCDNGKLHLDRDLPEVAAHLDCSGSSRPVQRRPTSVDTVSDPEPARLICMDEPITYNRTIPNSGAFRPIGAESGEYRFCPPQRWINNLHNSATVLLYHPCAPLPERRLLAALARSCLSDYVITPHHQLSELRPIALVSWGRTLELSTVVSSLTCDWLESTTRRRSASGGGMPSRTYDLLLTRSAEQQRRRHPEERSANEKESVRRCCQRTVSESNQETEPRVRKIRENRTNRTENLQSSNREENLQSSNREENLQSFNREENLQSSHREKNLQSSNREENLQSSNREKNLQSSNREENLQSSNREENLQSSNREKNLQSSNREKNLQSSNREENLQSSNREENLQSSHRAQNSAVVSGGREAAALTRTLGSRGVKESVAKDGIAAIGRMNEVIEVKERELDQKTRFGPNLDPGPTSYLPSSVDCDTCGEATRGAVVNQELLWTPRSNEALWAASALGFLLVLLTLSVLHTRLWRHWRTAPSLYWRDPQLDYDSVEDVIRRRLRINRRRRKRGRRQECVLLPSSSSSDEFL